MTKLYNKYNHKKGIINDAYYTPKELALRLINKTFEVIGKENINEIIEPSAGSGAFSSQIDNCIAYDLYSNSKGIIKQDFLKLDIPYNENRLIIGNPPFGRASILARNFIKHSNKLSGYYAYILPSSFLINRLNLNILYSENLNEIVFDNGMDKESKEYQERKVPCSFIIYKHTNNKITYPKYKLKDVSVFEIKENDIRYADILTNPNTYDFRMVRWGNGNNFGIIKTNSEPFTNSPLTHCYIKIYNDNLKDIIYNTLLQLKPMLIERKKQKLYCGTQNIQRYEVYKFLMDRIKELQ